MKANHDFRQVGFSGFVKSKQAFWCRKVFSRGLFW